MVSFLTPPLPPCRMLGYTQAIRTGYGSTYGRGTGIIWLSGVNCQGNETNIAQCSFPGWGINNCYHWRDVNVVCDSKYAFDAAKCFVFQYNNIPI